MPAFEYSALDATGKTRRGTLEADSPRQVRQQLREQGLFPQTVQEVSGDRQGRTAGPAAHSNGKGRPRRSQSLSAEGLSLLTRQLATLLAAGLTVEAALSAAAEQSEQRGTQRLILALRARVREGQPLAAALAEFPRAFPELYRATVAAGEEAGRLPGVLERLADYVETRQGLNQRIQLALFYPALLTLLSIAVVVGLLTFVVPQITRVFDQLGSELPPLTQTMIATSDWLKHWGGWLLAGLGAAGLLLRLLLRRPEARLGFDQLRLRLPLAGRLLRHRTGHPQGSRRQRHRPLAGRHPPVPAHHRAAHCRRRGLRTASRPARARRQSAGTRV